MSGAEPVQTIEVPESQTQHQGAQERETLSDPVPIECLKCGVQTSALESGVVIKLNGIQCPRCASVYQMMYRHMGGIPEGVSSMTAEQQKTFFKSSGSLLASAPKNGRWAMVKSALVKEMVAFRTSQVTRRVSEDYLPLSVWEKRGFDSSQIKAQGRKKDDLVTCFFNVKTFQILTGLLPACFKTFQGCAVCLCVAFIYSPRCLARCGVHR